MNEHGLEETIKSMRNRNRRLDREGDYWSQAEKDRLHNLFDEGIGLSEIAIRLQRTEPAVFQQIEKMDLYQRKSYPQRRRSSTRSESCLCQQCKVERGFCHRHIYEESQKNKKPKN